MVFPDASPRAPHAVQDGRGAASDFQPADIKRNGEHHAAERVQQVAAGNVTGVTAAVDQRLARTRRHLLHDNLRLIPPRRPGSCLRDGEKKC
jgi:hypothetical protein